MRYALILSAAAAALAGCSTLSAPEASRPVAIEADSISYATSACYGRCPIYRVTVQPDGTGVFEGIRFTAFAGTRPFRITPAQYRAFEAQLAPLRPAQGEVRLDGAECHQVISDLPGAEVNWTRAIGDGQTYALNYGCDRERFADAIQRLRTAPDLLPIQAFIGPR